MYTAPQKCPTCDHGVEIREVSCPACGTVVHGRWAPSPFGRLTRDQETFLLLFVRSRGNLSDVERSLGVSYPTVRAKLEEIITAVSEPEPDGSEPSVTRDEILARIARHELTVEQGLVMLQQLSAGRQSE